MLLEVVIVTWQFFLPSINPGFGIKQRSIVSVVSNWKTVNSLCFSLQTKLTKLHITCEGTIEDGGYGMLQVRCRGGQVHLWKDDLIMSFEWTLPCRIPFVCLDELLVQELLFLVLVSHPLLLPL